MVMKEMDWGDEPRQKCEGDMAREGGRERKEGKNIPM